MDSVYAECNGPISSQKITQVLGHDIETLVKHCTSVLDAGHLRLTEWSEFFLQYPKYFIWRSTISATRSERHRILACNSVSDRIIARFGRDYPFMRRPSSRAEIANGLGGDWRSTGKLDCRQTATVSVCT